MKTAKLDDWVKLSNGSVGIIEKFTKDDEVLVRIPSLDGWPFPKWTIAKLSDLMKTKRPSRPVELGPFEEAPF